MTNDNSDPQRPEVFSPEAWDKLDPVDKERLHTVYVEGFQSPLLPPEVLQRYGNVIPGLDSKLVQWVEEETKHRRKMEVAAFDEARILRNRSALAGPIIALAGLGIAGAVSIWNPSWAGGAVATVIAIVSVGGPFAARILAQRWRQDSQDENQR